MGGERPPGLNFKHTLRTIEKCKEMIANRPNKLFLRMWGRATGLSCQFVEFKSRTTKNQIMESLSKLKSAEERFRRSKFSG